MLRTSLCDLLGIDVPIILAGMGAGATSAEFAAAVSNQGGLGRVGSLFRTSAAGKRDIDALPTLTTASSRSITSRKPWMPTHFVTR